MMKYEAFFWLLPMIGQALTGLGSALGAGAAGAGAAGAAGAAGLEGVSGMLSPLLKSGMGGGQSAPQVDMAHAQPRGVTPGDLQALAERRSTKKLGL